MASASSSSHDVKGQVHPKNGIKSLSSGAQADGKLGNLLLEDIKYISGASEQNGVEVLSETSEGETKDIIYKCFEAKIFTVAAKLQVLAHIPDEVSYQFGILRPLKIWITSYDPF